MKFMGCYAFLGVLGLMIVGCGQNQSTQNPYPGVGYLPNSTLPPQGYVSTPAPSQPMIPNGQPVPTNGNGGSYSSGYPGAAPQGPGVSAPRYQQPNAPVGTGQPLPQSQGTMDGPVISPNPAALYPNASALPQNGSGNIASGPRSQGPTSPNAAQPQLGQPLSPANSPQPGAAAINPGLPQNGQGPLSGSPQTAASSPPAGDPRYQETLRYFQVMEVWENNQAQKAFSNEGASQFVASLYNTYPNFDLRVFDNRYREQHAQRIYGYQAVKRALINVGCNSQYVERWLTPNSAGAIRR